MMRKALKAIVLIAMLMGGVREARSEHVTLEEIALYSLGSQNTQEFSNQFKQFTKTDLTEHVFKQLIVWASAAAVTVDLAEEQKAKPTSHDPHHCNGTMCFEQWAYAIRENKFGLEKNGQVTKLVTTNIFGNLEATQYCYGYAGVISCTSDVANGRKLKRFMWFGLKEDGKGIIAQLFWADDGMLIGTTQ
jgi:hypothetical protein